MKKIYDIQKDVIALSAGHGGADPGSSAAGILEKDLTLKINRMMAMALAARGFKVIEDRTEDKGFADDDARIASLKKPGVALCIANHINAATSLEATGFEVIYPLDYVSRNGLVSFKPEADELVSRMKANGYPVRRAFSKANSSGANWYYMQRKMHPIPTFTIEYFFITNPKDRELFIPRLDKLVLSVVKWICDLYGVEFSLNPPKPLSDQLKEAEEKIKRLEAELAAEKQKASDMLALVNASIVPFANGIQLLKSSLHDLEAMHDSLVDSVRKKGG